MLILCSLSVYKAIGLLYHFTNIFVLFQTVSHIKPLLAWNSLYKLNDSLAYQSL